MNEGLEALERLFDNKVFISLGRIQGKKQFANDVNVIEKELKEWDYFDNELKKHHITKTFLKQFLDLLSICNSENGVNLVKFISENNVYDFQKKLKALEIIKEKKVNVSLLLHTKDYFDYNDHVVRAQIYLQSNSECLTQEEWSFLKEALL